MELREESQMLEMCIILETKNNMFKLGCKVGVLEGLFPFNTLTKSELRTDFEKDTRKSC